LMYFCWPNNRIMYGSSCAIMGNIYCNKCLHSPLLLHSLQVLFCITKRSNSTTSDWKRFLTKVLLGCAFTKFVVMALGIGLICLVKVEDILVVFNRISAKSVIT
jgi:hypothetical protein